jgi:hypothetical protein
VGGRLDEARDTCSGGGVCEDGAARGTERQAGGGPESGACSANTGSRRVYEPPGAPNFFSKMTVFLVPIL